MRISMAVKMSGLIVLFTLLSACGGGGGGSNSDSSSNGSSTGGSTGGGTGGGTGGNTSSKPVAAIVSSQMRSEGNIVVTLDGTHSFDSDGDIAQYQWTQTAGDVVALIDETQSTARFSVPAVSSAAQLHFSLKVTDTQGLTDSHSISLQLKPTLSDFTSLTGPVVLGDVHTPDFAESVVVRGDYAYVADWESGLQIIDISEPRSPQIVAFIDTHYRAQDIAISDDGLVAFVGDQEGLYAVDISNPAQPVILSQVLGGEFGGRAIDLEGDRLYASAYERVVVMDVADPTSMVLLGTYEFPITANPSLDLQVQAGIVYLARNTDGLLILDARNPQAVVELGSIDSENFAERLVVKEHLVYLTDEEAGVKVIDVANPVSPVLVATLAVDDGLSIRPEASAIAVVGDTALIGASGALQLWDISDSSNAQLLGQVISQHDSLSIDVNGPLVYMAGHTGMDIIDISHPQALVSQARVIAEVDVLRGDSLIVTGPRAIDVTNTTQPQSVLLDSSGLLGLTSLSVRRGNILYGVNHGDGLTPVLTMTDITDINNPLSVGRFNLPMLHQFPRNAFYNSISLDGDRLFVSYSNGEIHLIDISNRLSVSVSHIDLSPLGYVDVVGINGRYVYALRSDQLAVVDIADPVNPVEVGSVEGGGRNAIVDGDIVYLSGGFDFRVYSMIDPTSPQLIASIASEISNKMQKQGHLIFVGLGQSGSGRIQVVDVSTPALPAYTHLEAGGKTVQGVQVNNRALVTESYDADAIRVYAIDEYFL